MRAFLVSYGGDLVNEILPFLEGRGNDYSANLVVFPGKRPAHFLRKALAKKVQGHTLPPLILSMDELIEFLFKEKLCLSKRKLDALDAVALLYDIHRRAPAPVGSKAPLSPDSFFPLGMKLYRALEELLIEGVPPGRVRGIDPLTEEGLPVQTMERLQSLSFLYEQFYRKVESMDCSTRSLRYRTVAEKGRDLEMGEFQTILFAGFFAFTKAERDLIRRLPLQDRIVLLFQEGPGIRDRLRELGVPPVEPLKGPETAPASRILFYRSPDTHGQVFALNSLLRAKREQNARFDERAAIVLPSADTLFPLLHQTLSLFEADQYNISMGYSLHRTPIFGFLSNLMQLVTSRDGDRLYVPDYLKFVLHPYTKNIAFQKRGEVTRILFHTLEEEMLRKKTRSFVPLSELEEDEDLFKKVSRKLGASEGMISAEELKSHLQRVHANTIGKLLSLANTGDFALKVIEILTYIDRESSARLHPLFLPFAEAFIDSLHVLSRSLMKEVTFASAQGYFTLMRHYLTSCHVPFEGTPLRGFQVLGALETRTLQFDTVFFLDANEGVLPVTAREDSLLPFRARKALGLPTYHDRERLSAYYFETLVRSAQEAHIFFVETDRKERSRFVEKLLWERQKQQKELEEHGSVQSIQYAITLADSKPLPLRKTPEMAAFLKDFPFSASALDAYLTCPLGFYYRFVLGIAVRETATGDIERTDIGQFVHDILHEFFRDKKGRPLTREDLAPRDMERVVRGYFAEKLGNDTSGALFLLQRQIGRHLRTLLERYYLPLIERMPVTVLETEKRISRRVNGFTLTGRLDRVEQRGSMHMIVDYKTSANPKYLTVDFARLSLESRDTWHEAISTVQLPFYQILYSASSNIDMGSIRSKFLLLGKTNLGSDIEVGLADEDGADAPERCALLKEVIFRLLSEIVDPAQPFQPAPDRKKSCPKCDFKHLCGG